MNNEQLIINNNGELFVWSGDTYAPDDRVKSHDLEVLGTMTMGTNGLTLSGSFVASSGTFNTSTGVILSGAEGPLSWSK